MNLKQGLKNDVTSGGAKKEELGAMEPVGDNRGVSSHAVTRFTALQRKRASASWLVFLAD